MRLNPGLMLLAVACICTACATQSYTPDTPSEARRLNISGGDEIRVVTTNRERLTLKVQAVEADCIVGVTTEPNLKEKRPPGIGVQLAYADIAMLEACNAPFGCAYRPMIQQPAEAVRPEYSSYDCSQLDAAILKIDTVRWVIRDDGGELETSGHKAARYAGNLLMVPLSLGVGASWLPGRRWSRRAECGRSSHPPVVAPQACPWLSGCRDRRAWNVGPADAGGARTVDGGDREPGSANL